MPLLDAVRRPEYTGERRCWPCTYLNAATVLFLSVVAGIVWLPLAPVVAAVGAALIALRGYVVPGTPAYGPVVADYLPGSFRHGPGGGQGLGTRPDGGASDEEREPGSLAAAGGDGDGDGDEGDDEDGERVVGALLEAGIVVPEGDGEELALDDAFADAWTAEMAELRALDAPELAAAVAETAPFEAAGRVQGDLLVLEGPGGRSWLQRVQAIADAAAVRAMRGTAVPEELRARAAEPLRMFVPECPTTGGPVVETTVSSCCGGTTSVYRSPEQPVLACEGTDEVVFAFD
jgi:hypothetical protein